jgi:hypothetical protein
MSNYLVESREVKNGTVNIYLDDSPFNPRTEQDNLGHMICFHRRYNLGDDHNFSVDDVLELIKRKDVIYLNLNLYDHSGITMSTSNSYPYNDRWDAGQVGIIYVTAEEIRKEWKVKRISKKLREKVINILECEVKEYDQYLTGEVYGYMARDKNGNECGSCWGFFGYDSIKYMIKEGEAEIEWSMKKQISEHLKKLKAYIINHVPLDKRETCPV